MRFFDLDAIHSLEPMIADFAQTVPAAIRKVTGDDVKIDHQSLTPKPVEHGRQTILHRQLNWTASRNGSALKVEVQLDRYLNPNEASVNNTLLLTVKPFSRLALFSRVLLGGLLPLLGMVGGLLLWRFLQFDTGMIAPPWAITGLILGAIVTVIVLPVWTHRLGTLLEGKKAINVPARRRQLQEALEQTIESLISTYAANDLPAFSRELPHEPPDLAEYTQTLLADPDAAIAAYGLYDAARRETIAAAFTRCFNDAKLFQAYRQTLSTLGDERQAAI